MNLPPYDLPDLVHGALYTAVTAEGEMRFARFTEGQKEVYAQQNPQYGIKCNNSVGITLEFISDTDHFAMDAEFIPYDPNYKPLLDVTIDGVLQESRQVECHGQFHFDFTFPSGEHRILFHLPWRCETRLSNLSIDDNATLTPIEKGLRILALGDSITQGSIAVHPSLTYVSLMTAALDAEVINQGIGGYQFFKESITDAPDWEPDLITLAYGTNDFSCIQRKKDFIQQAREYIDTLVATYPAAHILAITPLPRGDVPTKVLYGGKDYTFTDAIAALQMIYADYPQITVLDGTSFFPPLSDFFAPDYLHPNDQGFLIYGAAVTRAIRNIIL